MLWDVDPQDWRESDAQEIARSVVERSRPGSVVLMHTLPQTAEALPAILQGLQRRRLTPVSLDEMFRAAASYESS
jgi:peptidoglycan/xylan/chitin deacetylase (PgdA/CDA1 family)